MLILISLSSGVDGSLNLGQFWKKKTIFSRHYSLNFPEPNSLFEIKSGKAVKENPFRF